MKSPFLGWLNHRSYDHPSQQTVGRKDKKKKKKKERKGTALTTLWNPPGGAQLWNPVPPLLMHLGPGYLTAPQCGWPAPCSRLPRTPGLWRRDAPFCRSEGRQWNSCSVPGQEALAQLPWQCPRRCLQPLSSPREGEEEGGDKRWLSFRPGNICNPSLCLISPYTALVNGHF